LKIKERILPANGFTVLRPDPDGGKFYDRLNKLQFIFLKNCGHYLWYKNETAEKFAKF
jgi:hypothetical protein